MRKSVRFISGKETLQTSSNRYDSARIYDCARGKNPRGKDLAGKALEGKNPAGKRPSAVY